MKKKIVTMILFVTMICGMAACGQKEETSLNTEKEDTTVGNNVQGETDKDNDRTATTDKENNSLWVTRTVEPPSLGEIFVKDYEIISGVSVKISTSPFDYDFDEIEKKLRANSFIADNYKLETELWEDIQNAQTYNEGDFHDYVFCQSINGESKDNQGGREIYADFDFTLSTDYAYFDNINAVSVSFKDILLEENGVQENIYSVLRDTLGEEVAEYLVYAQAEDENDMDFSEYVTTEGDSLYYFTRKITEFSDGCQIEFYMKAVETQNGFVCVNQGKTPMLQDAKYNLNILTEGNVSGWNIKEFSQDMPEYTSIDVGVEFIRNRLGWTRYSEAVSDDNTSTYELFAFEYEQGLYDVAAYDCPSIEITYTISERDDDITYLNVIFEGESGAYFDSSDKEAFHEKVFSILKEQITLLCPCLDPEVLNYENFQEKNTWSTTIPVTYLGKECECYISIELRKTVAEWKVEFNYR